MPINCPMSNVTYSYWYFSYPVPLALGGSRSV